jgi:hypothetical protein
MKKIIITTIFLGSITASYFYGLFSHRDYLPPYPQLLEIKCHIFPLSIGFTDTSSRTEVSCEQIKGRRLMVALVFGQSNSGNHGETIYKPQQPVYNFFRGRCYRAEDPLLGPTGDRGSVWSRLGDMLIKEGMYDTVVLIPIGVGTTTIDQWTEGGYLHPRIINAIKESKSRGLKITHMFWVQGGSEKRTSGDAQNKEAYKRNFMTMLRSIRMMGVDAPLYVAVATYNDTGVINDIRAAQQELVDPYNKIVAGPDVDALYFNKKNRWEEVHLSHQGLELSTRAWLSAIRMAERH